MGFWNIFKRRQEKPVKKKSLTPAGRRSFAGADTGRLLAGWSSAPKTVNEVLSGDLTKLRARSRDSFHNNDFVRRFVGLVKTNVVGPKGVQLQSRVIGRRGDLDTLANQAIESAWKEWSAAKNCDMCQMLPWTEMQRQAIASAAVDGEILAMLHTGPRAGKFGLMVEHLDPEHLDVSLMGKSKQGNAIRLGVEFDGMGRPVAYHLRSYGSASEYTAKNGKKYRRVPAGRIIHAFLPEQVSQYRGYPWTSTALQRLKMLDGYYEAAMVAARAGASKMGFITSADGASYTGEDTDSDGAGISEFEAGIIEQLQDGMQFQAFDPRYPHEQFDSFVKTCLQAIGGSLGVSYAGLSNDLEGVNYSSIRAGVLEEREMWKALQEWFVEAYIAPIFRLWLEESCLRNVITIGGRPLVRQWYEYLAAEWQPRRWAWVDPQKDMAANIQAIDNNITTVSAVIRSQGGDPESVFMERAREKKQLADLGLTDSEVVEGV